MNHAFTGTNEAGHGETSGAGCFNATDGQKNALLLIPLTVFRSTDSFNIKKMQVKGVTFCKNAKVTPLTGFIDATGKCILEGRVGNVPGSALFCMTGMTCYRRFSFPQVHSWSSTFIREWPRSVNVYSTFGGISGYTSR